MTFFKQSKIRRNERNNGRDLKDAFDHARNRHRLGRFDRRLLHPSERTSLRAVNPHSRIFWARLICEQISAQLCDDSARPLQPIYLKRFNT
jgi:hypothetical protein